jgi:hypothetical protein
MRNGGDFAFRSFPLFLFGRLAVHDGYLTIENLGKAKESQTYLEKRRKLITFVKDDVKWLTILGSIRQSIILYT